MGLKGLGAFSLFCGLLSRMRVYLSARYNLKRVRVSVWLVMSLKIYDAKNIRCKENNVITYGKITGRYSAVFLALRGSSRIFTAA